MGPSIIFGGAEEPPAVAAATSPDTQHVCSAPDVWKAPAFNASRGRDGGRGADTPHAPLWTRLCVLSQLTST